MRGTIGDVISAALGGPADHLDRAVAESFYPSPGCSRALCLHLLLGRVPVADLGREGHGLVSFRARAVVALAAPVLLHFHLRGLKLRRRQQLLTLHLAMGRQQLPTLPSHLLLFVFAALLALSAPAL